MVENLPAIIRESVKPMERIEGITIRHVEGLPGPSSGSSSNGSGDAAQADGGGRDGNLAEQVVSSALRYRSQAPFVDTLLSEIGLTGDTIHRAHTLQDLSKVVYSEPAAPVPSGKATKPVTN